MDCEQGIVLPETYYFKDRVENRRQFSKWSKKSVKPVTYWAHIIIFVLLILFICLTLRHVSFQFQMAIKVTGINQENIKETEKFDSRPSLPTENYLRIIKRDQWDAAPTNGDLSKLSIPATNVIIGTTNKNSCNDFESCKFQVLLLQQYFIQIRKFADIGFNFLIGGDGTVYEGIGWDYIGNHTEGYNNNSIGIGFIGDYQYNEATENQLSAAKLLIEYGLENHKLGDNYRLSGQRDILPALNSPGERLFSRIKKWTHYNPSYGHSLDVGGGLI